MSRRGRIGGRIVRWRWVGVALVVAVLVSGCTQSPTPAPSPVPTPTLAPSPTPTPTVAPMPSPVSTPVPTPNATHGVVSGNIELVYLPPSLDIVAENKVSKAKVIHRIDFYKNHFSEEYNRWNDVQFITYSKSLPAGVYEITIPGGTIGTVEGSPHGVPGVWGGEAIFGGKRLYAPHTVTVVSNTTISGIDFEVSASVP